MQERFRYKTGDGVIEISESGGRFVARLDRGEPIERGQTAQNVASRLAANGYPVPGDIDRWDRLD